MTRKGFIIDLNKCTCCHACILACNIENHSEQQVNWRNLYTYNEQRIPDIPVFHFSIACNHCSLAPCKDACPAGAYKKDDGTGAIVLEKNRCIGCKYCSWVCPYDAPKYNSSSGLIEKCTLCFSRLEVAKLPACVNMCPTGALDFDDIDNSHEESTAFRYHDIGPAVKIIPARNKTGPKTHIDQSPDVHTFSGTGDLKISSSQEWPLAIFTLCVPVLAGLFTGIFFANLDFPRYLYFVLPVLAILFSLIHLGRKDRAWMAIRNIRSSWLSREILFFNVFTVLSIVYLAGFPYLWIGFGAVIAGIFTLFSIDRVYDRLRGNMPFHSADTILTGGVFISLFTGMDQAFLVFLFIKLILYLVSTGLRLSVKGIVRITLGIVLPSVLSFYAIPYQTGTIFLLLIGSEVLDRIRFYNGLIVVNPEKDIEDHVFDSIAKLKK